MNGRLLRGIGCIVLLAAFASAAEPAAGAAEGKVVARFDFEGPYSAGEQQIQNGCHNNWEWGRKRMLLRAETGTGRPGTVQSLDLQDISSGAAQFFVGVGQLPLFSRSRYYRVAFWLKGEGVDGGVDVLVRKIGSPWTTLVPGRSVRPTAEWTRHVFGGACTTDMDRDLGVLFQFATVGKIWIDDIVVEEFAEDPELAVEAAHPPILEHGNLMPRSSCEGRRDWMWSSGIHGDADAEWEDPQAYRAPGGNVGNACLALPASTKGGKVFCNSAWLSVVPGHPYTFSVWARGDREGVQLNLHVAERGSETFIGAQGFTLGTAWQRCVLATKPIRPKLRNVFAGFSVKNGTVFVDGAQFEVGAVATAYQPKYPYELHADLGAGHPANLLVWGEPVRLSLFAAAADNGGKRAIPVEIKVVAYPDKTVWQETRALPVGEEVVLEQDLKRVGLFRVELRAQEPGDAAPQEALFAILPPARPVGAESLFGAHIPVRPFHIDYARRIGLKWVRFHDASIITKWRFAEPERGHLRWCDIQVDALRAAGLNILGLPDGCPAWAATDPAATGNVIDLHAFRAYCVEAARHYRGRIDHWEAWNEPYINYFFKGTPTQYGDVLEAAYRGLKEGNPEARVLGFCSEINGQGFVAQIPASQRALIDGLSVHYYPNNLTGSSGRSLLDELDDWRTFLGDMAPDSYWNSEGTGPAIGGNSFYTWLGDAEQNARATAFASRVWIEHRKAGMRFFLYTLHQSDTILYHGGFKSLIGYDRSPTPAAVACAVTAWCTDGLVSQPCPAVEGAVQGLFAGAGRVAWAVHGDPIKRQARCTLDLARLPATVRVLDVMGNDPRLDGLTAWEVGMQPLFLVSESLSAADLLNTARKTLTTSTIP
jgi:hypothetical protein